MASELPYEVGQFQDFLSNRAESETPLASLDEAVSEFREYQRQLADLKDKLKVAEEQSARGEVGPFDAEATKKWLQEEIAKEGITE